MSTDGGPSRTAQYMALFRALETARPARRRLFDDPYATRFLPAGLRTVARIARVAPIRAVVCREVDRRGPGARTSAIGRTSAIDDLVVAAVRGGAGQLAILGAGYDTRALRLPELGATPVFEVDRPAILAAKAERLPEERPGLTRVPIDFAQADLRATLEAAGFDPAAPACFLWEGVSHYLTAEAADATFRAIAGMAADGVLIFTYVHRGVIDGSVDFEAAGRIRDTVEGVGEPWTFGLHPDELAGYLAERGLSLVSDEGADGYRRRLLGDSPRALRGYAFYRLAVAEIG